MIRKATKTALLSAVALSAALVAQSASAALITKWNYTVESSFSSFSGTGGTGGEVTGSGSGLNGNSTTLSWGVPDNTANEQSSISIQSPVPPTAPGTIETGGAAKSGATFDHNNRVIKTSSISLSDFTLDTRLTLKSLEPATGVNPDPLELMFNSHFTETPNVDGGCLSTSVSTCDDIFVLSDSGAYPSDGVFTSTFTNDGYLYTVALSINGLTNLDDAQCTHAGAESGCVGFTTREDHDNQFTTNFAISARAVPEPGSLAILGLGLGLIGFGFYARRRNLGA